MATKGSGGGGFMFLLGIIGFFVLIWFATGGPTRPGSWTGPFLKSPTSPNAGELYSFPRAPFSIGDDTGATKAVTQERQAEADLATYGTLSPYRGKVEIGEVHLGRVVDDKTRDERKERSVDGEYVVLEVTKQAAEPIDVSGWALASGKYKERTLIPYGVQTLILGQTQPAERIVVSSGNQLIVTSGKSPVGSSFRENMCTGYLAQYQDFTPSLSSRCPSPTKEFDTYYTGPSFDAKFCRDHVASIGSCEYDPFVPKELPSACKPFVDQYLHHNGCVATHRTEAEFLKDTWRIYLGKSRTLYADTYETVRLLDADGRIVDVYAY